MIAMLATYTQLAKPNTFEVVLPLLVHCARLSASLAPEFACQPKHPIKFQKFQFASSIYKASYHICEHNRSLFTKLSHGSSRRLHARINLVASALIAGPTCSCWGYVLEEALLSASLLDLDELV